MRRHKRNASGFVQHLILVALAIFVLTAVAFVGLNVVSHHKVTDIKTTNSEADYTPGQLIVVFKDGVTAQQALNLIASYKQLIVEDPEYTNDDFTPKSYRAIKADQFDTIASKLKNYPEVAAFIDDSSDGGSRAGKGEKWVKVTWQQNVLYSRMKTILAASGLGLSNQGENVIRDLFITAPIGQESYYVNKLQQSSIVQSASRLGRLMLQ